MYNNLHKIFLAIALYNGGINRNRTIAQQKVEAYAFLVKHSVNSDYNYEAFDTWLGTKTDEEIEQLTNGEFHDIKAMLVGAPQGLDDFLNDYFDEVC